ncbi:hypothetical protein [Pseudoduganella chitinolytica]|uniref:Uncharacterized protein n=1 Tax=Pseudoduganella chitinolytica TaxID=34070 RepID=A0ABY8BH79_9BURK|nr:hypothetical protein [Pseudoduganella chitinolytica]WEF35240.1 hypothetical protein PX653_10930 [Pseudoduganella chitinolytica]
MSNIKHTLVLAVSLVTLAFGSAGQAQTMEPARPSWLLKPAINPLPNWYEVRGGAWRVPADVVEEMASHIKAEAGSSVSPRLDTYLIQYQGESAGSVRSVRLMGACRTDVRSDREFSERFYIVFDGGKCFFDATYDPEEKRFTSLKYHQR